MFLSDVASYIQHNIIMDACLWMQGLIQGGGSGGYTWPFPYTSLVLLISPMVLYSEVLQVATHSAPPPTPLPPMENFWIIAWHACINASKYGYLSLA